MVKNGEIIIDILKDNIPEPNNIMYKIYDVGHVPFPGLYDGLLWFYSKTGSCLKIKQ